MSDTLFEFYIINDNSQTSVFDTTWVGQTFTPSTTHTITSVKLLLGLRKNSPGTIDVSIRATSAGEPTGGDLTSGTTDGNTLGTGTPIWGADEREIILTPFELLTGVQYAIVIRATSGNSNNLIKWRKDFSNSAYAGGAFVFSSDSGSAWSITTGDDNLFAEFGTLPPIDKTFTAQASLSQDDIKKTFAVQANIIKAKQFAIDASLAKDGETKTFTAGASIAKDGETKTFTADAPISEFSGGFPEARPPAYDEDKLWDEETQAWYSPTSAIGTERSAQAGGRQKAQLVVLSDRGIIFFGAF